MESEDLSLEDRVALVTGAGAGIGRGIALGFAKLGAHVVIAEVDPVRAERCAGAVRALGREALVVSTDVMDSDQVRAAVEAADSRFGRLDVLVNNAGGVRMRAFREQSERSWRRHIDLNLVSVLAACHAAIPIMIREERGGSILNVVSIEAFRAAPGYAVYAACKAGLVNFTRTLAIELSEHGIRVNGIAPDQTDTPGLRGRMSAADDDRPLPELGAAERAMLARRIPMARMGLPDECARAAAFLVSDLGSYVTGTTLHVDGGTWASSGWLRQEDGSWSLG